jgi:hypothetical protein
MAKSKSKRKLSEESHKNFVEVFVEKYVGRWAFALGIIFALVLGLLGNINEIWIIILIVIGLIIGILNITEKETTSFLVSGVILIIVSVLGGSTFYNIQFLGQVLDALLMIFIPATVIVAIKNIFNLAKS